MTWSEDHAKFKMAAIFTWEKLIFYSCWLFLTQVVHVPELVTMHIPPLSILMRSFLGMLLAMLQGITLRRDMGLGHFLKWPPWKSKLGNISTSKWHRIIIWCLHLCFPGQKIEWNHLEKNSGSFPYGEYGKSQDGNWGKSFYDKIWMFILKTKNANML